MSAIGTRPIGRLVDQFEPGLDAPICLTWELTYACNLACVHCLSSSGRRDPRELSTAECQRVDRRAPADAGLLREHRRRRADRAPRLLGARRLRDGARRGREVLDQRLADHAGDRGAAGGERLRRRADLARRRDAPRSTTRPRRRLVRDGDARDGAPGRRRLPAASSSRSSSRARTSAQLDAFKAIADRYGAQLRLTRLRPSGRGADVWDELHPTAAQQRELYDWLLAHGEDVLTGDSFFHLARATATPLPGLNLCGAGRVVCLIDPVGDVYACPFAIHDAFLRRQRPRARRLRARLARVGAVPRAARARRRAARAA